MAVADGDEGGALVWSVVKVRDRAAYFFSVCESMTMVIHDVVKLQDGLVDVAG